MNMLTFIVTAMIAIPWIAIMALPLAMLFGSPAVYAVSNSKSLKAKAEKKVSVLVVDDDEFSVLPLVTALANRNLVDVTTVDSSVKAVEELQWKKYDMVFLDMMMPEKNGDEALKEADALRELDRKTPVVYYTSSKVKYGDLDPAVLNRFKVLDVWDKKLPANALNYRINDLFTNIAA